jgi:hypothetical protein
VRQAHEAVAQQRKRLHEAKFVHSVASALGWTPEQMRFPEEDYANASPAARQKAEASSRTRRRAPMPAWAKSP